MNIISIARECGAIKVYTKRAFSGCSLTIAQLTALESRIRADERQKCAKLAEAFATCGCGGKFGYCLDNDPPLAIAAAIRNSDAAPVAE